MGAQLIINYLVSKMINLCSAKKNNLISVTYRPGNLLRDKQLFVYGNKAVQKKRQVILTHDVAGIGKAGCLAKVSAGFFRNYLLPKGQASPVTREVLMNLEKANREEQERNDKLKAQADAIRTALATIGK